MNLKNPSLIVGKLLLGQLLLISCATYYHKNAQFNTNFEAGNIPQAEQDLANSSDMESGKDRFLYFVNFGVVASMLGEYEKSNEYLAKAYRYTQDD